MWILSLVIILTLSPVTLLDDTVKYWFLVEEDAIGVKVPLEPLDFIRI